MFVQHTTPPSITDNGPRPSLSDVCVIALDSNEPSLLISPLDEGGGWICFCVIISMKHSPACLHDSGARSCNYTYNHNWISVEAPLSILPAKLELSVDEVKVFSFLLRTVLCYRLQLLIHQELHKSGGSYDPFTPRTITIRITVLASTPTDDRVLFLLSLHCSYVVCSFKRL